MMAMSAKDPFWKAKVRQEIMTNPAHAGILQNKCLDCHAPLGAYTSKYHGNAFYSLTDLATDTLGKDGVSCGACHAIGPYGLGTGNFYSGTIPYDTSSHVEYGPFPSPYVGPMQLYEGFTPMFSTHTDEGRMCSSCHTLITQSVDLGGTPTGGHFVEQATYHEFVNSDFPANNIKCQTCHMPQIADAIILSSSTSGLTPRTPFNQHRFQGANYFMLNLIKNNKDSVKVYVPDAKLDSTIIATSVQLKTKSIDLNLMLDSITVDTAYFRVKIKNKAGHKFPSGYPSRRAVLQMIVTDAMNDTVFRSGTFNSQQRVIGENPAYEPHHAMINQSNTPQIYELVPGDVMGNFTSILERASILLKDNRIPPTGFTTSSPVYDTTLTSADANADADFNKTASIEGSGMDYVHFHVPIAGVSGTLKIRAKMYYQAVPPKWVDQLFTVNAPEVNSFKNMYQNADQTPFLMVADSLVSISVPLSVYDIFSSEIKVWPTISFDGRVTIASPYGEMIKTIDVYNGEGKLVTNTINSGYQPQVEIVLPAARGIYYLSIRTGNKTYYKKVVKS
jgi:hypothetical protein